MADSMKNSLTILIRRCPYGQIHAAEALRHMGGALGDGIQTNVLLVDDGVYVAHDGHNPAESGFTSLVEPLAKGIAKGARVYMHIPSAQVRGLLPLGPSSRSVQRDEQSPANPSGAGSEGE